MNRPCAVSLRPASRHDVPIMADMSRRLIETELAWRYTPARMAALIGDADTIGLVACEGSFLRGFAVMHFGDSDAHLSLLCVQPARQRQGIATRLIDWLLTSARVAGVDSIGLELRADNDGALAFYRARGFVETQLVPGYYDGRIAAQRMWLCLSAGPVGSP